MDIDLIVFGAHSDLASRKLYPALFDLEGGELLPEGFRLLALARNAIELEEFLAGLKERIEPTIGAERWSAASWERFRKRFSYLSMDFAKPGDYRELSSWIQPSRTSIFYLATVPDLFERICENLGNRGCLQGDSRIVLEKPIGNDLESCREVNRIVGEHFAEHDIYRIDHYLGKETVQNLLVLRFANRFISTQWDQGCIDHVQITVAEDVGLEGRVYYDQFGQLRDMVQSHLLQLLCLIAMEPPNSMTAEDIRNEKIKILRALRPIDNSNVATHAVRGRYGAGWHRGQPAPGYLDEPGIVKQGNNTETFVAIKAFIDNWRWAGVPFYLRTGKRMPGKLTEVVICYKSLPHNIFSSGQDIPNRLVIRLQPNEGIELQMVSKLHSLKEKMALLRQNLDLDFLGSSGMQRVPDAYERLLLDVLMGDQSLFVGREEVELSWRWCDSLISAWDQQVVELKTYAAGSWGPGKSEMLIERDGRSWHE